MKSPTAVLCFFGTTLAAGLAFAQDETASPSSTTLSAQAVAVPGGSSGPFLTQIEGTQWRGSRLVGVDVYGADDSLIGDINEVILDRNGQATAIVIGVGGFLGFGEKNVAIPWNRVKWTSGASGGMGSETKSAVDDRSGPRDMGETTPEAVVDSTMQAAARGGAMLPAAPGTHMSATAPEPLAATGPAPSSATSDPVTASTPGAGSAGNATGAQDHPDRAVILISKQDLQNAPEFNYATQLGAAGGGTADADDAPAVAR